MSISINLVVHNGEKFIRHTLGSVRNQAYKDFEVNILDNASKDQTEEIIKTEFPEFKLIENDENIGPWAGFEKLLEYSKGEYVILLTDVILKEDFLENAIKVLEKDHRIGALQAKVYQMQLYGQEDPKFTDIIDTAGFRIFRSRRVVNLGHGEGDSEKFSSEYEIFGVEGVVPIFRKEALEDIRINGRLVDPNYRIGPLGYGDDFDIAWRMNLFGWRQLYSPEVIAYHDRSTTKGAMGKRAKWWEYLKGVTKRQHIPLIKRALDWRNVRFTIIKNDYIINILQDLPYMAWREIKVLGYTLLFEPRILLQFLSLIRLLPSMLRQRKIIMARAKVPAEEIHKWFT